MALQRSSCKPLAETGSSVAIRRHHSVLCRMVLESLVIDDNGATEAHAREAGASYHPSIDDRRSVHLRRYSLGATPISRLNTRLKELSYPYPTPHTTSANTEFFYALIA